MARNTDEPLGQRLRRIRQRRGLTQRQVAKILGVHESYISFIEVGTRAATGEPPQVSAKLESRINAWIHRPKRTYRPRRKQSRRETVIMPRLFKELGLRPDTELVIKAHA